MWPQALYFIAGVVVAPLLKPFLRPVAKELVKGGLVVGHYVHRLAEEAREDIDDLAAEAKTELDDKKRHHRPEHSPTAH